MQRSESRILTTHTGSLPRPKAPVEQQLRKNRGEPVDDAALAAAVEAATRPAVERQLECGIDIGNDGEQPRESFFTYVQYRMSGFGGAGALVLSMANPRHEQKLHSLRAGADLATQRLF